MSTAKNPAPTQLSTIFTNRSALRPAARALVLLPLFHPAAHGAAPPAPDLHSIVRRLTEIAQQSKGRYVIWGRLAGSPEEHAAAALLADLLAPYADAISVESFSFTAHRPRTAVLRLAGDRAPLGSAQPAPFDARFPERTSGSVMAVREDADWQHARGRMVYVAAEMDGSPARTSVRRDRLYQRARDAGAAGLVFSLPLAAGTGHAIEHAIVPVDRPYAELDAEFPLGVRPLPAFAVSRAAGARLERAAARGSELPGRLEYREQLTHEGRNVVATFGADAPRTIALIAHLDSFFDGANDNATGLATLVGLAHELHALGRAGRRANILLVAMSAHHDRAMGMRDFVARHPLDAAVLIEHSEGAAGEHPPADWPPDFDDLRIADVGPAGWPELETGLPGLVTSSRMMRHPPRVERACLADLLVVCGTMPTFALMQAPPYYHTEADTLDKIRPEALARAVDFHLALLRAVSAITPAPVP